MNLKIIQETSTPFEEDSSISSDEDDNDDAELICDKKGDSKVLTISEF